MPERHDYERLYRETGPTLWRALYVFAAGRREVADDAVAEAFARAMEHDRSIARPVPWLYRTAFRLASQELRAERKRAGFEDGAASGEPDGLSPLLEALRSLSPSQRAAVFLHYEADLPIKEVARMMGTSVAAVKVHLHRGRRRLRDLLGEEDEG